MKTGKKEIKTLFAATAVLWGFVMVIVGLLYPEFIYLGKLVSAMGNGNILSIFYICGLVCFVMLAYISFICGLYVVYDETVGKLIRGVKRLFGTHEFHRDYCHDGDCFDSEYYRSTDVLLIAGYTFGALPFMMYLVWPALTAVLILILIIYCFLHG